MTRINTIPPKVLCDRHLLAEVRELPRILNKAKQGKYVNPPIDKFTLNTGHERSLLNKLKWLVERHQELCAEAKNRLFKITDYQESYKNLPKELYNDWQPTKESKQLIIERISERMDTMKPKDIRYYGEIVDKEHFKIIMREEWEQ